MSQEIAYAFVIGAAFVAASISYACTGVSRAFAHAVHAIDSPLGGRKIHRTAIPLAGGLGIAITIIFCVAAFGMMDSFLGYTLRTSQLIGFVVGIVILLIGGILDDIRPLPPSIQILFPTFAALAVIYGGTGIIHITKPGSITAYTLESWQTNIVTFIWLLVVTYATKILDGLDGLVTGLVTIGSGIVAALALSTHYFQPMISILSAAIGGAFFGFLPKNVYPAKQFLGESGSTIAGFSLGVLAILSGAKVAVALAVLAIPIADIGLVMIGRLLRKESPFKGDDTHLHFRLLKVGISQPLATVLYWTIAGTAGVIALGLQTKGKILLVASLAILAIAGSLILNWMIRRRSYEK